MIDMGSTYYQRMTPNPVNQHQLQRVDDERRERAQRIKAAWLAYHGVAKDPLKPTKTKSGQTFNDNVKLNYARVIVDTGVDYLFGRGLDWQVNEDGDTEEQAYLEKVWRANKQAITLTKLAQAGAIVGHAFLRIEPALPGVRDYPRLLVLNGEHVEVDYDDDDCETARRYTIQWTGRPVNGQVVTYRQLVEPTDERRLAWTLQDQQSIGTGTWQDTGPPTLWPWPFAPIIDCQNLTCAGEFYGISDLEPDLLKLNDAINYLESNGFRIHRFNAHPIRWAQGAQIDQLKADVDAIFNLPPGATLNLLQWGGNLESLRLQYLDLVDVLFQMARVPKVAAGKVEDIGALSGTALRILFQPLLAKTQTKRETYGDMLEEVNQRLLLLGGFERQDDLTSVWPELLPADPLMVAQATAIELTEGIVSKETASTKAGYVWSQERERIQKESLNLSPDATAADVEAAEQAQEAAQLAAAQATAQQPPTAPTAPPAANQAPPA